ncbi:rod shape-determining protein MreC [Sphingobacterium sp. DK4209]|uniref:Cell shape-determining protein MreC n=1 Tax=Sphingobacterium zhuxiongii TaxID=2662364 RepID=A0A5Q0QA02_9SPHI|nr:MULTISPECIES: rod shape-determining protein MreC [unclassified Sphingobacterium]MVZ64353.1 rod shape-determining protein MreC [Sphingobacterium sp. DK4209]QGA25701.1 rod shape-determining protein MreC [Sphingobacterium sp. dk4302]
MKNLWLFLVRYNAFFWFVLFFTVALILVVQNNRYQRSSFVNSSNVVVGSFYDKLNSWKSYLALDEANKNLAQENALLRQQLQNYILKDTLDSVQLQDSIEENRYQFVMGEVVNNSIHQKSNFITINKGALDGVQKGLGVITSNGVVGIVLNVSPHFSTIQSLLHPDTRISVTLDTTNVFGALVWGNNVDPRFAMVKDIPNHVKVKKGQKIYTSGFSLFPKGIEIGTVSETGIQSGESFLDVRIQLRTNFSNLNHVYVVKDLLEDEKKQLQVLTEDNNG